MSETNLTGRLLGGRYRIGRMLGQGGMGMVFEAFQEDLGRKVAVKLLRADDLAPGVAREALDRFQREARAAAALGSPHIVQIFDFQAPAAEPAFLVMELLEGRTLSDAVKQEGLLAPARVARIGVHVLSALAAAHGQGILHRDIKPANVFLSESPTLGEIAKVLDFGIAKFASGRQITQAGVVFGTAAYMSPEQATGAELDGRADVYSTSVTLYRALTGRSPFAGASAAELLSLILSGGGVPLLTLRPDLDPAFAQLIARGMAPDRSQRFPSADAMAQAIDAWLRGTANTAEPRSNPPQASAPPASMPPAPLSHAPSMSHASLAQAPTAALGPRPPAPQPRSLWLPLLAGLGLLLVVGVVLGGGGLLALWAGLFDSEPELSDVGDAGSAPSPSVSTARVELAPSGAAPPTGRQKRLPSTGPTPTATGSAIPDSGVPALPPLLALPAADKGLVGTPCSKATDCGYAMKCNAGHCECLSAQIHCGQRCVSLLLDANNCGKCFNVCGPQQVCLQAQCKPCGELVGRAWCKNACAYTNTDVMNCGGCGNKCAPGDLCVNGKCQPK